MGAPIYIKGGTERENVHLLVYIPSVDVLEVLQLINEYGCKNQRCCVQVG